MARIDIPKLGKGCGHHMHYRNSSRIEPLAVGLGITKTAAIQYFMIIAPKQAAGMDETLHRDVRKRCTGPYYMVEGGSRIPTSPPLRVCPTSGDRDNRGSLTLSFSTTA